MSRSLVFFVHGLVRLHAGDVCKDEVAAADALELGPVEVEQQGVRRYRLEVLDVVGVGHVADVLSALERIVRGDVTDEPLAEIGVVELPGERHVGGIDGLYSRLPAGEEVSEFGRSGPLLGQPVGTRCQAQSREKRDDMQGSFHRSRF